MIKETINETIVVPNASVNVISWSAIIIAALLIIGLSFLLNLLTIGAGLSAFTLNKTGQISLVMGGFIWLLLTSYFITFISGWIAGMLSRACNFMTCCNGIVHGFSAWCLALIITVALFSQSVSTAFGTPAYYTYNKPANIASQAANQIATPKEPVGSEAAANKLGVGIFGIFFIFFAGALGSCIGGYIGGRDNIRKEFV